MKCQILFSGKIQKKNVIDLSSPDFAKGMVKVKHTVKQFAIDVLTLSL